MIRSKFFSRFIVVTLTAALLLVLGSRANCVYALADPVQAVAPVFDTQIIQLADYIDNGGMTGSQLDIFYFLAGALAVGQLGAQDAKLVSPYPNEENVKEWLINCGIQLYNSLIGLVPSGDYYVGVDYPTRGIKREELKAVVALLMGDAVVAANYTNLDDYLDDNPDHLYIPFNRDLQLGVNAIFGLNGGAYDWQMTLSDWADDSFNWKQPQLTGTALAEYNGFVSELPTYRYLANFNYSNSIYDYGGEIYGFTSLQLYDLFIDTTNHTVSFHNAPRESVINRVYTAIYRGFPEGSYAARGTDYVTFRTETYNPSSFESYQQIAKYYLNFIPSSYSTYPCLVYGGISGNNSYSYFKNTDFLSRVMVGPTWDTAQEIQNLTDLNFDIDNIQYYQQVTNDYLLDIRGLIGDLVNYVYVRQPVWDNIYLPDGTLTLPDLIQVTVDLTPITDLLAPPIPVDLNEIAELTDNTYLERIKEEAQRGGNALAYLVAFWHNCDAELIYVMFGAGITVLVGAFIGKWGHS